MDQSITAPPFSRDTGQRSRRQPGVARLWSRLTAAARKPAANPRETREPVGAGDWAPLDVDGIAARLAVEERARSDGTNEQPPSAEESLTGTQREIVAYFKELQRRSLHQAVALADGIREHREAIDLSEAVNNLHEIVSRCESKLLRLTAEFQPRLNFLEEREKQQHQHYTAFREANSLHRVAEYPRSSLLNNAFIAALIVAGSFAIGNISASGFGSGALLPASRAVSLSLIGVLVPFALAATIGRSVNHVRRLRRLAGWLGNGIAVAFVAALAFYVAHYLAAVAADPGANPGTVIDSLLRAPTAVGANAASWTGFGIVMTLGLLALVLGHRCDDPYPGYGAIQRAYYRARSQRELLTRRLRARINAIVDEARAEVTELPRRFKEEVRRYSRLVDESKRASTASSRYIAALQDTCNVLLERYRTVNAGARQTEAPRSFSAQVRFTSEDEPSVPTFDAEEDRLAELQRGIAELDKEVAKVRQQLSDLNWNAISALEDTPDRAA